MSVEIVFSSRAFRIIKYPFWSKKSISVLEGKIEELRNISSKDGLNIGLEVSKLEEQLENKLKKTYSQLTPWDKVKVARHPLRPHASEIIKNVFTNRKHLAGDRGFKEDNALLGGVAKLGDVPRPSAEP